MEASKIRNIAIIAHVDHGKTTLVDKLLHAGHLFKDHENPGELIMDSNDLERERGLVADAGETERLFVRHRSPAGRYGQLQRAVRAGPRGRDLDRHLLGGARREQFHLVSKPQRHGRDYGQPAPLLMELPAYHRPTLRHLALGLLERARIFLRRVGTTILALMVVLWALSSFPAPPPDAAGAAIEYSFAGRLGALLAHVLEPVGFNWQISIALVSGLAAREVAVGALGTVYAVSGEDTGSLATVLAAQWSLATALSLLAWYVFAPQCASTLAVVKRETNSWRWPIVMFTYMLALAYLASFATYQIARALGG